MVVGLTGQTGAGKTTVSEIFARNGFDVINADLVAREIVEPGTPCLNEIADQFSNVIQSDGSLNRKALGQIVFTDKKQLEHLNRITHPYLMESITAKIKNSASQWILLDAPTLFESGADSLCNCTVAVLADQQTRKQRIMLRDDLTEQQAMDRISSQHGDDFYKNRSNYTIDANGSLSELKLRSLELINQIKYG